MLPLFFCISKEITSALTILFPDEERLVLSMVQGLYLPLLTLNIYRAVIFSFTLCLDEGLTIHACHEGVDDVGLGSFLELVFALGEPPRCSHVGSHSSHVCILRAPR
jgi:hypothetical protein